MDRHPGDLGQFAPRHPINLLRRGMVPTVQDRLEHGAPLHGDWKSALAMGGEEAVDPLLLFRWTHVSEIKICAR